MEFPNKEIIERVQKMYSAGCRVKLLKTDNAQAPSVGTLGWFKGWMTLGQSKLVGTTVPPSVSPTG